MKRALVLALAVIGLLAVPAPEAVAKGPESATIEGGGRVVEVRSGAGRGSMADLLDVTSFWELGRGRPVAEPARRGPAYLVRYVVGRTTAGQPEEFRQVLYPASSAGSVVHTPGEQRLYGAVVPANWAEAPVNLSLFLRSYGIMVQAEAPTPTSTPTPVVVAELNENRRPEWWPAAGLVVLVLLGVTGAWLVRRRLSG